MKSITSFNYNDILSVDVVVIAAFEIEWFDIVINALIFKFVCCYSTNVGFNTTCVRTPSILIS